MTTPKELVESQFPNYFLEQYPQFVKFVEEYYNFLESSIAVLTDSKKLSEGDVIYGSLSKAKAIVKNISKDRIYFDYETKTNQFYKNEVIFNGDTGEVYFIRNLYKNIYQYMKDIEQNTAYETTMNIFKKYFKKNVSLDQSIFRRVDPKTLTKRILDYYKNKTTENSYYWFFRIFFDDEIELYYPKVDILKLSDSAYYEKNLVQVDINKTNGSFTNTRIYAPKSKASAICKNTITNFKDNSKRAFIDLIFINGKFEANEEIIAYDISTGEEVGRSYIIESIIGVEIKDGGIGHKVDDRFVFNDGVGRISQVKKHSITNINIVDPGIAYRVGDPIVFNNDFTGASYSANAYVSEINVNPTLTKYFNDYYNLVKNRPVEFYKGKSLLNEVFTNSGTFQNTTPQLILPTSISSEYEVGSIKSIRFENSGLEYNLPPRVSAFNPLEQASLMNYFDLTFREDDANAQFIVANTVVNFTGGTSIPNDENVGVCIGEVAIDNDKNEILLEGLPFKSEDFVVKRFITQRSVNNLEDDSHVDFEYDNGIQTVTLSAEIIDLLDFDTLNDTAELDAVIGEGIAQVELKQMGLMVRDSDPIRFLRNPQDYEYDEPEIAHGLLSELEYQKSLMFKPFGDFLNNQSKLSSDKYFFDNHYYQHYSYEIKTKIPASYIEPLLLDELHPAGFLAFIRNKFEEELDLRIKAIEFPEIEIESMGYLTSEVYPFTKIQTLNNEQLPINGSHEREVESFFLHNEEMFTRDFHEIEVDGIADIFEGFKYFIDDIITKPVDNSFFDFENYLNSNETTNLINNVTYYDGIVAVESFMKIINVEDEANWIADVIKYKVGPINSMRDKTIKNFRITTEAIREYITRINKGGIVLVRDASLDYDGYLLSSDDEQFSNTNIQFSDTYDREYIPVLSGNALNEKGGYLPDTEILTRDYGWVRFKNLKIGTHVARVKADGTVDWVIPREIVKTQYSGDLYQFTDNDKISITVAPYQELVTSDENDNLSKIKSQKLNIGRTPNYFYGANKDNAYTNNSVLSDKIRIKNNIKKYKLNYTGNLYCVLIDEFEYEVKMPSKFGESDLDLVHMVSAINNEYTIPKLKTIEEVLHNDDFLEGIKLDFSFMQTIQPPSNTIIFDFNSNTNVINPYPEVAPTEVFFFSSLARKADSLPFDQEPSIVVDLARINPLVLEHLVIAKPEIGVDFTQQEYFSFGDYGQYFQFLDAQRPQNITHLKVDLRDYQKDEVRNALILELIGMVTPEVIYDVPLHTVINADFKPMTITVPTSEEFGETQIGKIINEDKDTCDFRIERFADASRNKVSTLSFSNAISSLKEGEKPKTQSQIQLLRITLDMTVSNDIAEISTVLCPDHQFEPKGIVTVLNKFEDKQKNKVGSLISAASAFAYQDDENLGVLLEQGDIINWDHITELIPKDADVRYVISRLNQVDQSVGTPVFANILKDEESVYGYGLKKFSNFDSFESSFDNTDIFFDHNNVYKYRRNTIFDRTVFNAKLEIPAVLNHAKIDNFILKKLNENHELEYENYITSPFQVRSTEEDTIVPRQIPRFDNKNYFILKRYDDNSTFDTTIEHPFDSDFLFDKTNTVVEYDITFDSTHENFFDNDFSEKFNYIDKRGFNVIAHYDLDTKETFKTQAFNTTPYLLHIDLSYTSSLDGADALSTLTSGGDDSILASNLQALETDTFQRSHVPILDRYLFFDYNERIRDWYNIYFSPYIKAVQRDWMGDLLPSVKGFSEPYVYLEPVKKRMPLLNYVDTIVYFPNTVFLDSSSVIAEYHDKIQYKFDVESRKKYIDLGDIIKPWVDIRIKDHFKVKTTDYDGDTMPFMKINSYIDIETIRTDYVNPSVIIDSTVYYPNTTYLSAESVVEDFEAKIVQDHFIMDRNKIFSLDQGVVAKILDTELEETYFKKLLRFYDGDTIPSVTIAGDTDIEMYRTILGSTPVFAKPDNTVYYPNTTYLSAESVVEDYEAKIVQDLSLTDRNSIFNLYDREISSKILDFYIPNSYYKRILKENKFGTIPRVSIDSMTDVETYRSTEDQTLTHLFYDTIIYFPNTTFLDATSETYEINELEYDSIIPDRNKIFSLNNIIAKWYYREMKKHITKQRLLDWDKNGMPSPVLKLEPEYTHKINLDLSSGVENHTTVYFPNTTFLDASASIEEWSEDINFENQNFILDKNTVIPLQDKPFGTKWYYKQIDPKEFGFKISDYNKNYIPSVSVHSEPNYVLKGQTYTVANHDTYTTVTFPNTTFLDATAAIGQDSEFVEFENLNEFLDKNKIIGLNDKIYRYRDIDSVALNTPIIPSSREFIPSVSVDIIPHYIHKIKLDSTINVDYRMNIEFDRQADASASKETYTFTGFEYDRKFLNKDTVIGLNDKIFAYNMLDDKVLNKPIIVSSKDYIPSVSVHFEPNYIHKAQVHSYVGYDSESNYIFANTTFLDATTAIGQDSEFVEFENLNEFLDKHTVIGLNDKIYGLKKLDDVLDKPIVVSSKKYIPSVSAHFEPNYIHKAQVHSYVGYDSESNYIFANTTFLDATSSPQEQFTEFSFERDFKSDYKKISKDMLFVKKYNEKISDFLNHRIIDNFDNINKIASIHSEPNYIHKTQVDSTTNSDTFTNIIFGNTTFLDSTSSVSDIENKLTRINISYTDDNALSKFDVITKEFENMVIEDRLLTRIVDSDINIRPALKAELEYTMSHISDDVDTEILKPEVFMETSYDNISNDYAGLSTEISHHEKVEKIFNEVLNRNLYFETDKIIQDFIINQIFELEEFKLSDYLGETIPSVQVDTLSHFIFEPIYNIREFERNGKLIKTEFALTNTTVNYEDTHLTVNSTFGVANTTGYVNTANNIVDGYGFEINSINNGITIQEFLLNNYLENYLNETIKYYNYRQVKRRNNYRRYNHSSLKMNYVKSESYTWDISALNTGENTLSYFTNNYNDPNINRPDFIDNVRVEI